MYPENLKYTDDHEWLRLENGEGVIGITNYAQDQLGDVVFVEMPEVGDVLDAGESFGVIESVKTVSDLYMPINGKVTAVNEGLEENPELINEDPYGEGWIVRIEVLDKDQIDDMMDSEEYKKTLE